MLAWRSQWCDVGAGGEREVFEMESLRSASEKERQSGSVRLGGRTAYLSAFPREV